MTLYFDLRHRYRIDPGDVLVRDVEAINGSIDNILSTRQSSWLGYREFGSIVQRYLFEPMNEDTADSMLLVIFNAIERWEPRVRVDLRRSYVKSDLTRQVYIVRITYVIQASGQVGSFDKTFKIRN